MAGVGVGILAALLLSFVVVEFVVGPRPAEAEPYRVTADCVDASETPTITLTPGLPTPTPTPVPPTPGPKVTVTPTPLPTPIPFLLPSPLEGRETEYSLFALATPAGTPTGVITVPAARLPAGGTQYAFRAQWGDAVYDVAAYVCVFPTPTP